MASKVSIRHDCPHCGTKKSSFWVVFEHRPAPKQELIYSYLVCNICDEGCVAVFHPANRHVAADALSLTDHYKAHPDEFFEINFWPAPEAPALPEHLPKNVRTYFEEAVNNIKTGPNAAGAMLRKTIDVGLKHLFPEAKGTLIKRIDQAAKDLVITPELATWAHRIRLEGNDASHDEDPFTPDEAKELYKFTDLVLRYLFTLPGMLEASMPKPSKLESEK